MLAALIIALLVALLLWAIGVSWVRMDGGKK